MGKVTFRKVTEEETELPQPEAKEETIHEEPNPEVIVPPKNKGGRPRKDRTAIPADVEPLAPKSKEPSSGGKKKKEYTEEYLASMFFGLHELLGMSMPEFRITKIESELFGKRAKEFVDEWGLVLSGKILSAVSLAAILAMIEVPRARKLRARLVHARRVKVARAQGQEIEDSPVAVGGENVG